MPAGYYRFPTLHNDTLVFVCEDDLWTVPVQGGIARRLTSNLGEATRPWLSPDGTQLAFIGREEGQSEVYLMPALGGRPLRLTYLGDGQTVTAGWAPDGKIVFATNAGQPFQHMFHLHTVDTAGGPPERLNVGPARTVAFGPNGARVIGRNTTDPARWKRYRGGTAGQLWIDSAGDGEFQPLLRLPSSLASPAWLGGRIYFVSDHEGIGNLYSCLPSGQDLRRHTDHADYYVRNPSTDGRRIVYHAGADLYLFDPATGSSAPVPIEFHSPQTQRSRKFVDAGRYLHDWAPQPNGHSLAVSTRGQVFAMANWEGAAPNLHPGDLDGVRYRLPQWLNDGKRLVAVTDSGGEEGFVILHAGAGREPQRLPALDIGRPFAVAVNPRRDQIAFSNHRYELLVLDLETHELRRVDRGKSAPIGGFDWSPDGAWLAYSVSLSLQVMALRLWRAESGETYPLTRPVLRDLSPAFDAQGKYLYFISYRHFDPVYDNLHFDLNFPRGVKPFLITLQKTLPSPFVPAPKSPGEKKENDKKEDKPKPEEGEDAPAEAANEAETPKEPPKEPAPEAPKPVQIDLEGIEDRVIAFPVDEGRFGRVLGLKDGRVVYSRYPVEGALNQSWVPGDVPAKGALLLYNFEEQKEDYLIANISDFDLSRDRSTLFYRAGNRLRALKAGDKPDREAGSGPSRKSGWIDLGRIKVSVTPVAEWRQMFREAWRLQRDQFWSPDMGQVDWLAVHNRYLPLVDRVSSRSEFSDLMWEMQGELGTSHAYEIGGDYRPERNYAQGQLGAEFAYDEARGGWRITHIIRGDPWDDKADSALNTPGVQAREGDVLVAVNGRRLSREVSPAHALVNLAGSEVTLTFAPEEPAAPEANGKEPPAPRTVTVATLRSESPARYREWVEENRRRVHAATGGRVGYVQIPDMGPRGYAEFHRGYLAEVDREGLVVDLRYNGGGHVSPLILEKLARRRLGYDVSRWGEHPVPFPPESVFGPVVALTNEHAGSDGDIFSQGFKMLKLGPLLGTRTWGGVIGIEPRQVLVDGTVTTQPEFSFWFNEVGWGVENYGVDPDIEVVNRPQDYARGVDAQLERAIAEALKALEANPPQLPDFSQRPSLALPRLPGRNPH